MLSLLPNRDGFSSQEEQWLDLQCGGQKKYSNCMTIVPDVLHDFGLTYEDPTRRSSFHMGENDEALRQRFLSRGFVKCNVVHFPAVIESMDPALFIEAVIDGAASTKKEVKSFSKDDQKRVHKKASNERVARF
jgi:hypothetical protein